MLYTGMVKQRFLCIIIWSASFLIFLYHSIYIRIDRVRVRDGWNVNKWGWWCDFRWNFSDFLIHSPGSKFFLSLYNFQDTHAISVATRAARGHSFCPTCQPLYSCNTSCYSTHTTYAAFPQGHRPVYSRKHVHILSRHPHNLWVMLMNLLVAIQQ